VQAGADPQDIAQFANRLHAVDRQIEELERLSEPADRGRIESLTRFGPHDAIVPTVAGRGYVTGSSTFQVDARDPLGGGFLLQ